MNQFIRNALSLRKLRQLCVNTALSNFVGFAVGSLVMVLTTYESVERRALKNLFGILPRGISRHGAGALHHQKQQVPSLDRRVGARPHAGAQLTGNPIRT
jgi:hypothetical protein